MGWITALILLSKLPEEVSVINPVSLLNAVWVGQLHDNLKLQAFGHLFLVFPLGDTAVSLSGLTINANQYAWISQTRPQTLTLQNLPAPSSTPSVMVLWLSPGFINEMTRFLNIPDDLGQLLNGIPLIRGDQTSSVLDELAQACISSAAQDSVEDLFLEIVGEVLRLLQLRQQAVEGLVGRKQYTVADLLPRLLQARQFIEANYKDTLQTQDVADFVALSEYHFARLFKAAFDVTVRQYIIRLRLNDARRTLEMAAPSVTEIAYHVGYQSLSTFIHAFRRQFGLSPSQYRATCQQQLKNSRI